MVADEVGPLILRVTFTFSAVWIAVAWLKAEAEYRKKVLKGEMLTKLITWLERHGYLIATTTLLLFVVFLYLVTGGL